MENWAQSNVFRLFTHKMPNTVFSTDPFIQEIAGPFCDTYVAVTFLFQTLESWLTPHFKGNFMDFPTK